jgi:hypothetical protein
VLPSLPTKRFDGYGFDGEPVVDPVAGDLGIVNTAEFENVRVLAEPD